MKLLEVFLAFVVCIGLPFGVAYCATNINQEGVEHGRALQKCEMAGGQLVQGKCFKQEIKP